MLFYFVALLTTAIVLLIGDPRSGSARWASFFLASASVGGLVAVFRDAAAGPGPIVEAMSDLLDFINQNATPYGVLMFAITYASRFSARRTSLLLALPLLAMAAAIVGGLTTQEQNEIRLVWVGPYYLCAVWLLLRGWYTESNRFKRKSRFITVVLVVPTVLAILLFLNIGRTLNPDFPFFPYVAWFIGYSLGAGLLFALLGGVLGLRIRLEQEDWETAWNAARTGTAMLNHAIKNEVGKIALCTDNLLASPQLASSDDRAQLAIIADSASHLQTMAERMQGQLEEYLLSPQPISMRELLNICIADAALLSADKPIRFEILSERDITLSIDPSHLREAIGNLLRNAVEAMPAGGTITVSLSLIKHRAIVDIRDEGTGIAQRALQQVLEPFYSTKRSKVNYGLGLSYCFYFMRRNGGSLKLDSEPGQGTTVRLLFPTRLVVKGDT